MVLSERSEGGGQARGESEGNRAKKVVLLSPPRIKISSHKLRPSSSGMEERSGGEPRKGRPLGKRRERGGLGGGE